MNDDHIRMLRTHLARERSSVRRRRLHATILARSYGCVPSASWEALLRADGSLTVDTDHGPRPHSIHRLAPLSPFPDQALHLLDRPTNLECRQRAYMSEAEWAKVTDRTACLRMAREIEGCKRALWLGLLWMGADVSGLRERRYHPDEFMSRERWAGLGRPTASWTNYPAWAHRISTDGDSLDRLLQYLRGLIWRRAERGGNSPSGEAFLFAVEAALDRMAGIEEAA